MRFQFRARLLATQHGRSRDTIPDNGKTALLPKRPAVLPSPFVCEFPKIKSNWSKNSSILTMADRTKCGRRRRSQGATLHLSHLIEEPPESAKTHPANMSNPTNTASGSGSKLTFVDRLVPPMKVIGQGPNALQYPSQSPAWSLDFSRDGQWMAVCYGAPDPCVRLWRKTQKNNSWTLHSTLEGIHARTIRSVAFAPLSNQFVLAAASFDASVSIWEFCESAKSADDGQWECTTQLEGHESEIKAVTWNSTGSLLATCGRDKTVWVWETWLDGSIGGSESNEFECIAVLNGSEGDVKCIQFAPSHGQWGDGDEILISAGYDDTIRIWAEDAGDWYCAMSISDVHSDTIWSLALAPGGCRLVSASADGSLAICKCYTSAERKEMENLDASKSVNGLWKCVGRLPNAHSSTVYSVAYAPAKAGHGRIASGGGDNRIQVYREVMGSTSDKPMFTLDAAVNTSHGDVNCVRWHPWDASLLCSAGDDGSIQLWHFESW